MGEHDKARRAKLAPYAAPAVLTLTASEYAKAGSVKDVGGKPDKSKPPKPPKNQVKRKD